MHTHASQERNCAQKEDAPAHVPRTYTVWIPTKVVVNDRVPNDHHRQANEHDKYGHGREYARSASDPRCGIPARQYKSNSDLEQRNKERELQYTNDQDREMSL